MVRRFINASKIEIYKKNPTAAAQIVFRFLSKNFRRKESYMHGALNEVYL
jgi:hypothetical protein